MSSAKDNHRIAQLSTLLQQQGKDTFTCYALALEYRKAGETAEAIRWFRETLTLDPEYLAVYYQLGMLHADTGEMQQALTTFDQGIRLAERLQDLKTLAELKNARMNAELEL